MKSEKYGWPVNSTSWKKGLTVAAKFKRSGNNRRRGGGVEFVDLSVAEKYTALDVTSSRSEKVAKIIDQ